MGIVYKNETELLQQMQPRRASRSPPCCSPHVSGDNIRVLLMEAWSHLGYLLLFSQKLGFKQSTEGRMGEPSQFSQQE